MKNDISLVMITQNEEKDIKNCLNSISGLVSEMVIIDSGSTDKTLDIAKDYGARIYKRKLDNFGRQKNFAISKTKNDWILNLDADEMIPKELKTEIKKAINSSYDGFYLPCDSYFLGKRMNHFEGWHQEPKLRLFKKSKMLFQEQKIHEQVKAKGKIGSLKNPILHYSYSNIKECLKKAEEYSDYMADPLITPFSRFNVIKIFLKPPYTFLKRYFYQLGFLDSWRGFCLAALSAYHDFKVHIKVQRKMRNL